MNTVELTFLLEDVATFYDLGFRRINISRSDDAGVSYYDITHTCCAQPPQVTGTSTGPWDMDGKHLVASLSGTAYDVEFVGSGDWDIDRIDSWLRAHSNFTAEAGAGDVIVLSTTAQGSGEWINVGSCSAADAWGLTTLKSFYGISSGITIYADTVNYTFYDTTGDAGYYYRYRLETENGEYSRWSEVIIASPHSVIGSENMCTGTLTLVGSDGFPVEGAEVVVSNYWSVTNIGTTGSTAIGFVRTATTDKDGKAELELVRGMEVDLAVSGTSVVRRIVIPDSSTVDLLDPDIAVTPDKYTVQYLDIPSALRHS